MVTKTREANSSLVVKNLKTEVKGMENILTAETKKFNLTELKEMTKVSEEKEKAVVYCRVNTDGTIKPSLNFQEREDIKYATTHNLEIEKIYKDAELAWLKKRNNNFLDMLKYVKNHPEIKNIIFFSEEIMSRNILDKKRIYDFAKINNKTIHFVKGNKISTKSSSPDELLADELEVAILEGISNAISKKTIMGMIEKAKYGILPLKAPFGYINNLRTKMIDVDNKIGKKIKNIFEILAKGNISKEKFIKLSIKAGIHPNRLISIIQNPFYYGDFFYKGTLYHGKHIPLVSRAMWLNANKNLNKIN